MKQNGHLKTYDLTLKTVGPVHIGTGEKALKSSYLYDKTNHIISILDSDKLIQAVIDRQRVDEFEEGIVHNRFGDPNRLFEFLSKTCGMNGKEIHNLVLYNCDAGEALDEKHNLRDIQSFIRRGDGRAYIPGSSLKGALRTVLLFHIMRNSGKLRPGKRFEEKIPEADLMNTLTLKKDRMGRPQTRDAVNSIMRGISVSDSEPVANRSLTLCNKIDVHAEGDQRDESRPNVCRECIRPGTEVHFAVTIDESVMRYASFQLEKPEDLYGYLDDFIQYYKNTYESHFDLPDGGVHNQHGLILGGGSGFFSKTLTYPYYGEDALDIVIDQMSRSFKKHHHDRDRGLDISPRTMKYTEWDGKKYPFGLCEVTLA